MTAPHDLDRQLAAFLSDGPTELPDPSFDAVRDRMETTRQRVVLGPWRVPDMSKFFPYVIGTAAVVVAVVFGIQILRPAEPSGPAALPSVQPSATPSPTPSTAPSASPAASTPPLTETFTSQLHGISVSYPKGWTAEAATEPWTDGTHQPISTDSFADDLYHPVLTDHLFLSFASQPLGDSTPDEWVAAQMAGECPATEPIAVDGATGLITAGDCDDMVAVATADRGYWIILRTSDDDPAAVASYDRAWFEEVLATVQLQPEDAVDVGAVAGRPSTISARSPASGHDPDRIAGSPAGCPRCPIRGVSAT